MQGIIILSLKKAAYSIAAYNLALSIKHFNKELNITLLSDGTHKDHLNADHLSVFNSVIDINLCDYIDHDGSFQPALAKINLHKYSEYKKTLYIDADSLVLKDLQPLFDKLNGHEFKSNLIPNYTQWTDKETFESFFGIPQGLTINTSWIYWESDDVFIQAREYYFQGFPLNKIEPKWGGTFPDELFFNAAINKLSVDPSFNPSPMFFGNNIDPRRFDEIENDFFAFTLYGNRTTVRKIYQEWYDRLMFKTCAIMGKEHRFKSYQIMTGKHLSK